MKPLQFLTANFTKSEQCERTKWMFSLRFGYQVDQRERTKTDILLSKTEKRERVGSMQQKQSIVNRVAGCSF